MSDQKQDNSKDKNDPKEKSKPGVSINPKDGVPKTGVRINPK